VVAVEEEEGEEVAAVEYWRCFWWMLTIPIEL